LASIALLFHIQVCNQYVVGRSTDFGQGLGQAG
jgi:hypothetical protein